MELKDIKGRIVWGGKNDTIDLLEKIAEAILKGGITIDDVRLTNNIEMAEALPNGKVKIIGTDDWKKISFFYRFEDKENEYK